MRRVGFLLAAIGLTAVTMAGAVSCGDDDDDDGNGNGTGATATTSASGNGTATATTEVDDDELTAEEQQAIEQTVIDYLAALRDEDQDRLRQLLRDGTGDAEVTRRLERARDHMYQLVRIEEMDRDGDRVEVELRLRDGDGNETEAEMTLERDQDRWRVVDTDFDD